MDNCTIQEEYNEWQDGSGIADLEEPKKTLPEEGDCVVVSIVGINWLGGRSSCQLLYASFGY